MTESAQLFKGVHDTPVYTDILFNKPLRLWVAISLYGGTALTVALTILTLDSGHARAILICGLLPHRRRRRRRRTDAPRTAHPALSRCQRMARPASHAGQQRQRSAAGATAPPSSAT